MTSTKDQGHKVTFFCSRALMEWDFLYDLTIFERNSRSKTVSLCTASVSQVHFSCTVSLKISILNAQSLEQVEGHDKYVRVVIAVNSIFFFLNQVFV